MAPIWSTAYLGLGSNLGAPAANLRKAIKVLAQSEGIRVVAQSNFMTSKAMGPVQPDYVNAAVQISTKHSPLALLESCQAIERQLGRSYNKRWQARLIDIDILLYEDLDLDYEALTIPHPGIAERPFVTKPLQELGVNATVM